MSQQIATSVNDNGKVFINFELTYREQLEIENICTEQNKTFSQYFLELHRACYDSYNSPEDEKQEEIENEGDGFQKEKPSLKKENKKPKNIDKK
jgi:hypothetical protein